MFQFVELLFGSTKEGTSLWCGFSTFVNMLIKYHAGVCLSIAV